MTHPVKTESDIEELSQKWQPADSKPTVEKPKVLTVADLLALDIPEPGMLIEGIIPRRGASLIVGPSKSGKTLLAAQAAIAIASGTALFQNYRVVDPGPVMLIEQDDPDASASVTQILRRSSVPVAGIPFHLVPRVSYTFGTEFIEWLEEQIVSLCLRFVALDSYTALRGPRPKGVDIVKAEHNDLTQLDELAKRTNSALGILHHNSKGSAGLDWSQQAGGTFAMTMATEAQIVVSRFSDLEIAAPERLVRIRGRHMEDLEMVLRFRKEQLDYEHVMDGGGSSGYPLIQEIRAAFGSQAFGPKELTHATGISRATASRQISLLFRAGVLTKRGYGDYVLDGVKP